MTPPESPEQPDHENDHIEIDCMNRDWVAQVERALRERKDVHLCNFDYGFDGDRCWRLAATHKMRLLLGPKRTEAFIRQKLS